MTGKPKSRILSSAVLVAVLALASCKRSGGGDRPEMRPPEQIGAPAVPASGDPSLGGSTEAQDVWLTSCAPCHGEKGRGDGPNVVALKLTQKPRDYTKPEVQSSFSDEEIYNIVLYGGPGVGKSADMPSFGNLQGRNDILGDLVKIIRGFEKK